MKRGASSINIDETQALMDGFVSRQGVSYSAEKIKERVDNVENKIQHLGMTIDKYRLSGEKKRRCIPKNEKRYMKKSERI